MIMSPETYLQMKQLIADYEKEWLHGKNVQDIEKPYLIEVTINTKRKYNPKYGDNRECKCGDPYYRHFDTYEQMRAVGCKYCDCCRFEEK